MKIALDASHWLHIVGKQTPDGIKEWTFNDRVLRGFKAEIEQYKGVQVKRMDDATGQRYTNETTKAKDATKWGAEVYIAFDHNSYIGTFGDTWGGSEAWIARENSRKLAQTLLNACVDTLHLANRGVKVNARGMATTRDFTGVSVIMEIGFMDSNKDRVIREEAKSLLVGKNMAIALAKQYGLTKDNVVPKPDPKPDEVKITKWEKGKFTCTEKVGIITRDYPSTNAKRLGGLAYKGVFNYDRVFVGNGYVWIGDGKTWIPTSKAVNGHSDGNKWGTFGFQDSVIPIPKPIKQGDRVNVKRGARDYNGNKVADFIYNNTYVAYELRGTRAVLGKDSINTPFNVKDLVKA